MIRWWRDDLAVVPIEGGEECPKCGRPMQRFRHSAGWRPPLSQGFFHWWDVCGACGDTQYYERARGEPGELPDTSAPMQMILF
jgi:hypothetical protein